MEKLAHLNRIPIDGDIVVEIFSINGRRISNFNLVNDFGVLKVDIKALASDVFIYSINSVYGVQAEKFFKNAF